MHSENAKPLALFRSSNQITVQLANQKATIEALPAHTFAQQSVLQAAFSRLADVDSLTDQVLVDSLLVLLLTLSEEESALPQVALNVIEPSKSGFNRTAAHPRGFKGTKYQPPKPKKSTFGDLRVALCNRKHTFQLLDRLWGRIDSAVQSLRPVLGEAINTLIKYNNPPNDVYLAVWHKRLNNDANFSLGFKRGLFWLCKGMENDRVYQLNRLCESLNRDQIHWCARILNQDMETGFEWIQQVAYQSEEHRLFYLETIHSEAVFTYKCDASLCQMIGRICNEYYKESLKYLIKGLKSGVSTQYLLSGVTIHSTFNPNSTFYSPEFGIDIVTDWIADLSNKIDDETASWLIPRLWQACGKINGLDRHLNSLYECTLPTHKLSYYLRIFSDLSFELDYPIEKESWKTMSSYLPDILKLFHEIDDGYADQAGNDLGFVISSFESQSEFKTSLPKLIELVGRYSKKPFSQDSHFENVVRIILKLDPDIEISDETLLRLSKLCINKHKANLFAWGMNTLLESQPNLIHNSIHSEARALFKCCSTLGCFFYQRRRQILLEWIGIFKESFKVRHLDLLQVIDHLKIVMPNEYQMYLPKTLKQHLSGEVELKENQLKRHQIRLVDQWTRILLNSLHDFAHTKLSDSIQVPKTSDKDWLFALKIYQESERNRTAYRKFLKAFYQGNDEYLWTHPLSLNWIKRHPELNVELWKNGPIQQYSLNDGKTLTLSIETNPLEVIKMGQYVGSCLSLGGLCSYSASAVLLDINKQVVFARNAKGKVVARQLLVISEHNKLVPYHVYPNVSDEIKETFEKYLSQLAACLNMDVSLNDDSDIELILAKEWWDDGGLEK